MKQYECLVPGCSWHTRAGNDAEIVRRASEHHARDSRRADVRPEMVERIKQRIHEEPCGAIISARTSTSSACGRA